MTEQLINHSTALIAALKGFDEICSNCWRSMNGQDYPVNAPPSHEMIDVMTQLFIKYEGRPEDLYRRMDSMRARPLRNSTLPEGFVTRPTQDLLRRWLLELHNLNVNVYPEEGFWHINIYDVKSQECIWHTEDEGKFEGREEALELGLSNALLIIE